MALEVATYINDLVIANPPGGDLLAQADDHIRLNKTVNKNTFAGFTGAVLVTGTDTGVANAYALTPATALPSYVSGMLCIFTPTNVNTGAATVNISGLGAKSIKTPTGAALSAGDLPVSYPSLLQYNGTDFILIGGAGLALKTYVDSLAFSSALPNQATHAGQIVTTNGTAASWTNTLGDQLNNAATVTVASATTTDIGAAASNDVTVSGVVTITGLGTIAAGATRKVKFSGALTLTHNATSLILPGSANISTAANDTAQFTSLGAGNWICDWYKKADGTPVVTPSIGGDHCITLHTGNGYGSTNTTVRRFTTVLTNTGTDLSLTQSSTLGDSIKANTAGLYNIYVQDVTSTSGFVGFTVNGNDLTVGVEAVSIATRGAVVWATSGTRPFGVSRTMRLAVNDVLRVQSTVDGANNFTYFSVRKVGT